ncbi:UNVERIFIED_CONTAM: hypothetical protein HDU68_009166 [Siphonaria sp. JEL0065]|nr:hypothetical protein HDU68_009166 [Siphonaria sp. JEL0065]
MEGGGFDNSELGTSPLASPKSGRARTKTQTNEGAAKGKKPLNTQLSSIVEVPSSDERTRPTTAAVVDHKRNESAGESLEELGSNSPVKHKSPPPLKKVTVAKKKLTQIESPEGTRKSGDIVAVKKSKLKAVESGAKPAVSKAVAPTTKPLLKKPNPKVVVLDDPEVSESQEFSAESSSSALYQSESDSQEFSAKASSEELESAQLEEEEEEVRSNHSLKSKVQPERERAPSKKQAESAKLNKSKKAATPKSPTATRLSSSHGSHSEKFQRRLQMKLDNDGFSAMGLSPTDDFVTLPASKTDSHKRASNQPAPPPHYLTATTAIPTTKREVPAGNKGALSRNPSSRRKAIKTVAYGTMGVISDEDEKEPHPSIGRFGHYDVDDRRSKSLEPGEYRNNVSRQRMASDYANGRSGRDNSDEENIQELENGVEYRPNRNSRNDDENNSNSSQEYRYSDRISRKYIPESSQMTKSNSLSNGNLQKIPDRLMLSSSALKAAQEQGMVSPETVQYLKWYMVKAKPLEAPPSGSLTDVRNQGGPQGRLGKSGANLKQQFEDEPPRGRPLYSTKKQPTIQRGSIMDDEPASPKSRAFATKTNAAPLRSGSIMDDRPQEQPVAKPPRPIPKTRVTIVSKPKTVAAKKASPAKAAENVQNSMPATAGGGFWPQGGASPFMGGFSPFMQQPGSFGANPYLQQNQNPYNQHQIPSSQLPAYNSMKSQAPSLPSLHALQLTAPQFTPPPPTVHPGLMPARIKLTTVPVVTFKQSYVIEPTGHSPGTYIPPEEMGVDANGGMLTYISTGSFPSQFDMGGGGALDYQAMGGFHPMAMGGHEPRPIATATTVRSMGAIRESQANSSVPASKGPGKTGVRSMIQRGVIGRGSNGASK